MKNTPLGWKTITKPNVEKPVIKSMKTMKSIVETTHILSQKPVQSVRPQILLNTNPIVSHSIESKSSAMSSYRPILPKTNSIDIPPKRCDISSILLPQNVVIDVSTKQKSIPISIRSPDINQITMNSKSIKTSPLCKGWTPLAPKIKYSKIILTKSEELNDSVVDPKQNSSQRLNAPIITTEAALAALSAFSDSNSSVDTMKVIQSQDVPQSEVFPLQHNFEDSVQVVKERVRVITPNCLPITGAVTRQSNKFKVLQKSLKTEFNSHLDFTQNCEQTSGEVIDFIQID